MATEDDLYYIASDKPDWVPDTIELLDNEKPHPLPKELGVEIFRCQVGSGVHGVTVGGQDDRDEMGLFVERPKYLIGLEKVYFREKPETLEQYIYRTQPEGARSGYGDLDLTVYTLRKWTRLALGGNPTVLLPLFVPDSEVVLDSTVSKDLRAHTDWFLSRNVAARFLGYMQAQREQMLGLRGKKHTNRPELVEKHGYDTKFAYHMLRLGVQGVELLTTGRITLPMADVNRNYLIEVRKGTFSKKEVVAQSLILEENLLLLQDSKTLPEQPNYLAANNWLIDVYQSTWEQFGWV